ncbi:MAG: dTDP-4-dehydrorhamnose 3,5-epimerase [Litorimonas sp.]
MDYQSLSIPDVVLFSPVRYSDVRGYFSETFRQDIFDKAITPTEKPFTFVQDNQSLSAAAGTIRGLHYQSAPHAQGKLVSCVQGAICDVAVDIRLGSPSYGQYVSARLSADNGRHLWVPVGFAHGFSTLEADTIVQYKCTDYYAPDCEGSLAWDDAGIGIDWELNGQAAILSSKDQTGDSFADFKSPFKARGL